MDGSMTQLVRHRVAWLVFVGWAATPRPRPRRCTLGTRKVVWVAGEMGEVHAWGRFNPQAKFTQVVIYPDDLLSDTKVEQLRGWLKDGDGLRVVWRAQRCQRGSKGLVPLAGCGAQHPQNQPVGATMQFIDS